MKALLPVTLLFAALNANAAITSPSEITHNISQSVHESTERLKAFVASHGPAVASQVQSLIGAAINEAEQITALTVATAPKNPNAHQVTLLCAAIGGAAGAGLGATDEVGLCFDLEGRNSIASNPGKYAYIMNMAGLGKVHGMSMVNNLILLSGSINDDSSIPGHYIGAHGIPGIGAGAFTKQVEGADPRIVNPLADKIFVHDVTFGIGASVSLTADALDIRKL